MPDNDLAVTGQDASVLILEAGNLVDIIDQVVSFSENARYEELEVKPLGTANTRPFKDHTGWEGDIEISENRPNVDLMMDRIHAARRNRTQLEIRIRVVTRYRNGQVNAYTYPEVQLGTQKRRRRAETNSITLSWMTGRDRIQG